MTYEKKMRRRTIVKLGLVCSFVMLYALGSFADSRSSPPVDSGGAADENKKLWGLNAQQVLDRSAGCLDCHNGIEDIHNGTVRLGCVDCHGGDPNARISPESAPASALYQEAKRRAHVQPRFPEAWRTSANPVRSYTLLNKESPDFIQFVNPGDLRVASRSCGVAECHPTDVHRVPKSMMAHGAMLWGAALYNNGSFPLKNYRFGESYAEDGTPRRLVTVPQPTPAETSSKGVLPFLDPLPRWEITQMGNILRTFERGGRKAVEVGLPNPEELAGKPTQNLLSFRGLGTLLRTDPVFLGLQKTRLLDPMLSFMGTNDQPGDYRSSGCTACHVVYANDRNPYHSGPYAEFGHTGLSRSDDRAIPKNEAGHPIKHQFTRAIPSSQCVVCHMHPGTLVMNSFYGYTWWDLETDGEQMYPAKTPNLTDEEKREIRLRNPEESALRGKWGDPEFLKTLRDEINPKLKHTQFADFTGHGWIYRSVFKKDRKGSLLDSAGNIISNVTPENLKRAVEEATDSQSTPSDVPVHLKDIHLEKGMHCVDCHFKQDNHGNGKLYGEVRNAIEIDCVDCHGTVWQRADPTSVDARTSAAAGGNRMLDYRETPSGSDRFFTKDGKLFQRAAVARDKSGMPAIWEVKQIIDTVTPGNPSYNEKAALAKTIQKDGKTWGGPAANAGALAHPNSNMTCYACHTSWTPSCFGCHLKMTANVQMPMLHNEGDQELRNWTSYNFQTLRDDVFMLGRDGTVTGRRFAPVRSSCAVQVSSQNQNREWIYSQQQTVSAEGYSGQAFTSHFPHTVRTKETRECADCHISDKNDNNARMAMALIQGTNFYNFIGRYAYVALGSEGFGAVVVTERDEPQAVIGSSLHSLAFPAEFKRHKERDEELHEFYEHPGNDIGNGLMPFRNKGTEVLSLQLRGEYLYAATGRGGLRVYDVANIDQKGFSERITTAPFSPLGQRFYVNTKYATAVASPSTLAVDPTRTHRPENEEAVNRDDRQAIHPVYAYLYVTDRHEGLILVGAATLLDGDPKNNFLKRALTFNPNGLLNGANNITIAGTRAYITCDRGLVVLDINDPLKPRVVAEIGSPALKNPRAVQVQFRYAFVCDAEGVKVIDLTDQDKPHPISSAVVPLSDARSIYVVRTFAYVAAGKQGLVILDIERPEQPRIDQIYGADGKINDANDVKVGMTNVSLFAYVADGHNGLRVVQLTSPNTAGNDGFSPRPEPHLIASHHTHGPALAVSEGLDRDRAVDENGNQLSVFNRRGARPLNSSEMRKMYLRNGAIYKVPDIQNNDPKQNSDIRRFYGPPAGARSGRSIIGILISGIALGALSPLAVFMIRRRRSRGCK